MCLCVHYKMLNSLHSALQLLLLPNCIPPKAKNIRHQESQARQEFVLKCLYTTGCKSTGIVNSPKKFFSAKAVSPAVHSSGPFH